MKTPTDLPEGHGLVLPVAGDAGRDDYIVALALTYALATIDALPKGRQDDDIRLEMEQLLANLAHEETREQLSQEVLAKFGPQ